MPFATSGRSRQAGDPRPRVRRVSRREELVDVEPACSLCRRTRSLPRSPSPPPSRSGVLRFSGASSPADPPPRPHTHHPHGDPDATATHHPGPDAIRQIHTVRPDRARGPHVAERDVIDAAPQWCSVDLRDGNQALIDPMDPDSQDADVHRTRRDGLQGDRDRLPVGEPTRLRLPPPADRGGPDSRRRLDPGAGPMPRGTDRAHLRGAGRRTAGDRALLQLDQPAAARRRVQPRQGRHQVRSPSTAPRCARPPRPGCRREPTAPPPRSATSTAPRASRSPNRSTRSRCARP